MSEIDLSDARRRCADLATAPEGGHGRNLSVNDQDAIVRVLSYVSKLETEVSMRRDEMERMRRQRDAAPTAPLVPSADEAADARIEALVAAQPKRGTSAPLIPQSRAEEMIEAERQACEDISARVSDDNNCGCGVGFAIVSAICSRAPSPERQKKETGR